MRQTGTAYWNTSQHLPIQPLNNATDLNQPHISLETCCILGRASKHLYCYCFLPWSCGHTGCKETDKLISPHIMHKSNWKHPQWLQCTNRFHPWKLPPQIISQIRHPGALLPPSATQKSISPSSTLTCKYKHSLSTPKRKLVLHKTITGCVDMRRATYAPSSGEN